MNPTLIFLDTEFSDFINTELISIGLVSQDDRHFYAELPVDAARCNDFVRGVVLPQLGKDSDAQCTLEKLNVRLRTWLEQFKSDEPLIVCFDYSGDWALFSYALFDEVPSWIRGANVNGYLNALRNEIFWMDSKLERHHALNDAMALKASFVLGRAERADWLSPTLLFHPRT